MLAFEQAEQELNRFGIPISEATDIKNQFNFRAPDKPQVDWSEVAHDRATRAYYATENEGSLPRSAHRWRPPQLVRKTDK